MDAKSASRIDYAILGVLVAGAAVGAGMGFARENTAHYDHLALTATKAGICGRQTPSGWYPCQTFLVQKTPSGVSYASLARLNPKGEPVGIAFTMKREVTTIGTSFNDCLAGTSGCETIIRGDPRWEETQAQCLFAIEPSLAKYPSEKKAIARRLACNS